MHYQPKTDIPSLQVRDLVVVPVGNVRRTYYAVLQHPHEHSPIHFPDSPAKICQELGLAALEAAVHEDEDDWCYAASSKNITTFCSGIAYLHSFLLKWSVCRIE